MESDRCSGIRSIPYNLNRLVRLSFGILLNEDLPFPMDFSLEIV